MSSQKKGRSAEEGEEEEEEEGKREKVEVDAEGDELGMMAIRVDQRRSAIHQVTAAKKRDTWTDRQTNSGNWSKTRKRSPPPPSHHHRSDNKDSCKTQGCKRERKLRVMLVTL